MRTLHKWAIGGSLTAAFGAVALWPVEMQIEGPVTNTFSIGSLKPDVWDVEQVYIAPENTDIPFQRGNSVKLDVRGLKLKLVHGDHACGMYRSARAEIRTNRAAIIWDQMNHLGLHTTKFEATHKFQPTH